MTRLAAFVLIAATLAACHASQLGGTGAAIPGETGVGPRSSFIVATPAGLLGLDAQGRPLGRLVELPAGAVPSSPALHPDGKTIFFALSQTLERAGFGSEIYRVDLDGRDLRPVITRDQPNVFYASPSFDTAGNLYVHRRFAKDDPDHPGVYLQATDAIERVDLRTGERRKVLDDGAEPAAIPAGDSLVFVRLDRGQPVGLWTASSDGTRAEPLLKTGDRFWYLQSPRISPTGREVTWSSAGRSSSVVAPATDTRVTLGGKLAHLEIPSELYVAPLDGTRLRSIAVTRDDVVPAWSPDGTRIAYIALATFYVVSASEGNVLIHSEGIGFNYGDLIWIR